MEKNSKILILYLYLDALMYLLTPILNNKLISNLTYLLLVILILFTIYTAKFKFNYNFINISMFIFILMIINLLLVSYRYFVIVEIITFLLIAFIPLLIITSQKINYEFLLGYWFRISRLSTIIYPIYLYLYSQSYINYGQIGYLFHINLIIQLYFLIYKKEIKISNIILIILNFFLGLTMGSRGILLASILVAIGILLILPRNKGVKYYISIITLGFFSFLVTINLNNILNGIYNFLIKRGIRSRNLRLFIFQLEGGSSEVLLSGREELYNIVLGHIKNRNGFPSGLGVVRYITDDRFKFSHNVILDLILLMGVFGAIIFVTWYLYRSILLYRHKKKDYFRFCFFIIIAISFWVQALMGKYFINNKLFWIATSILIINPRIVKNNK